jgi:hypothetical protein
MCEREGWGRSREVVLAHLLAKLCSATRLAITRGCGPVVLRPLVAQGLPLKQYETYTEGPLRRALSDSLSWHWDRPVTWLPSRDGEDARGEPRGCYIATVLRW